MYETEKLTRLATSLQFTVKKLKLGYNRINTVFGRFDDSRCCDHYANLYYNLQKNSTKKKDYSVQGHEGTRKKNIFLKKLSEFLIITTYAAFLRVSARVLI